jgi:predicted glycosyltransferase
MYPFQFVIDITLSATSRVFKQKIRNFDPRGPELAVTVVGL